MPGHQLVDFLKLVFSVFRYNPLDIDPQTEIPWTETHLDRDRQTDNHL